MRTVDLFSGCGGMSLGFQSAGYNIVAAFENWPAAIECYKQNFKHPVIETDLSIVDEAIIRIKKYQPDLIIGGPPCQDFSNAGNRTEGERAELTHSFAKIITAVKPKFFVMENVARASESEAYKKARKLFIDNGYGLTEIVLDASHCNVPQKRNRFFCIGGLNQDDGFLSAILRAKQTVLPLSVRDYYSEKKYTLEFEYYALQISTQKLREAVSQTQTYYPEEVDDSGIDFEGNGTKIVLTNLKKSRTTALAGKLKQRLARRFAVIGADKQFEVKVNGEPITISDRNYLTKAQYLWYYLRPADEDIPAQPADEYTKQCKSGVLRKSFSRSGELSIAGKPAYVYGWIATAPKPGDLDDDENINRIAIMVRGKMAKDDMLNEIGTTALYSKYIFGELNAEFLDTDEEADITTSSRQDFFDDDERYVVLKKFIESELAQIRADWEAERSEAGEEEACKYEVVREWYSGLIGDEKKAAKQLFGKINQLTVTPDEKKDIFKHGILAFESLKLKNELSALQDVQPDNLDIFLNVAGRLDSIEATYYYQIVKSRLAVIQRMKEVVHGDDLEKVIQRHLANNLWLLDPAWDRDTKLPSVEEAIKTQFDVINAGLTREEQEARLDVRYQKPSGKHVIIELKRGDRTVKFIELIAQVDKYFSALTKILKKHDTDEDFEIIVLLGKRLDGEKVDHDIESKHLRQLAEVNTRILYYDQLLANAETLYADFIAKNSSLASLETLINSIG